MAIDLEKFLAALKASSFSEPGRTTTMSDPTAVEKVAQAMYDVCGEYAPFYRQLATAAIAAYEAHMAEQKKSPGG